MWGSILELRLAVSVLSGAANAMESCCASGHGKHVYVGFFQALNPTQSCRSLHFCSFDTALAANSSVLPEIPNYE